MTEPNSNKSLNATAKEIKQAAISGLEYTLSQIKGDMLKALKRGDTTKANYYREQYAITEAIIYAFEHDRIARTDAELKAFQADVL